MEKVIDIGFTEPEWNVLLNMVDVAVKSSGLQSAKAGVFFLEKIKAACDSSRLQEKLVSIPLENTNA